MCGIVGYVGNKNATPVLIKALKKLEYRGYDSAGIAIYTGEEILVQKAKGKLINLAEKITKFHRAGGIIGSQRSSSLLL